VSTLGGLPADSRPAPVRLGSTVVAEDGRPWVVLFNTVGIPRAVFDTLIGYLAPDFSVVVWDTRYLPSDNPLGAEPDFSTQAHVADACALLAELGIEEFIGVGWCASVDIMMRVHATGRFRMRAACSLNGAFVFSDRPDLASSWEATVEPVFRIAAGNRASLSGIWSLISELEDFSEAPAVREETRFPFLSEESLYRYARLCLGVKQSRAISSLPAGEMPVLFLAGNRDAVQPHLASEQAHRRSPGSEFVLVDGGTHAMFGYRSDVCALIRRFCLDAGVPARR
jgi:pimeloyl-ACP methyl ester carboxylesterase